MVECLTRWGLTSPTQTSCRLSRCLSRPPLCHLSLPFSHRLSHPPAHRVPRRFMKTVSAWSNVLLWGLTSPTQTLRRLSRRLSRPPLCHLSRRLSRRLSRLPLCRLSHRLSRPPSCPFSHRLLRRSMKTVSAWSNILLWGLTSPTRTLRRLLRPLSFRHPRRSIKMVSAWSNVVRWRLTPRAVSSTISRGPPRAVSQPHSRSCPRAFPWAVSRALPWAVSHSLPRAVSHSLPRAVSLTICTVSLAVRALPLAIAVPPFVARSHRPCFTL